MARAFGARFVPALLLLFASALPARAAEEADTVRMEHPPGKYEIVVSAERRAKNPLEIPNATAVVTGRDLKRRGVRTLAEALQDIPGLDTGEGSDNGALLPNVGMWGLKEFDALLFMLNGVPVGGPFNPSLSQIPVEDIDRIEVVKGPQGTLYGVSAFAGMIQVFTREAATGGEVTVGGGSFSEGHGNVSWGRALSGDRDLRVAGSFSRTDGWVDRTEGEFFRGSASLGAPVGSGRVRLDVTAYKHEQDWAAPLPFDAGELVPGFKIDHNYAVRGAEVGHEVFSATSRLILPVGERHRFENTLAFTHDKQDYLRSFPGELDPFIGDTLDSEGLELEPTENSLYEDARIVANLQGAGTHELVGGASLTYGKTKGEGREFEFAQLLSDPSTIPSAGAIPSVDDREFEDQRVFFGAYVHDAWTPVPRFTLAGGGRVDVVSEELETEVDTPGGPMPVKDSRDDTDFSGDVSALFRLVDPDRAGAVNVANLYASLRRAFKPAAPNLAEAEAAEILEPENTTSWEVGLKTQAFSQLAFEVSGFDMRFKNTVVAVLDTSGLPALTNAGELRFRGFETHLRWAPFAVPGLSVDGGYAFHNARFVDFTFVTPDGSFRDVSGNKLELVPRHLVNGRVGYTSVQGVGGWVAARYQGERPFNRRNTAFAEAYTEWDAGLSYERDHWRAAVVGRNLGDDRHVVSESEIGDSQFYVAPPRRFSAELTYRF